MEIEEPACCPAAAHDRKPPTAKEAIGHDRWSTPLSSVRKRGYRSLPGLIAESLGARIRCI